MPSQGLKLTQRVVWRGQCVLLIVPGPPLWIMPAAGQTESPEHRCHESSYDPPSGMGHNPGVRLDLVIMFGAFVLASALAGVLGAVNLGTALAFGQIGFAISAVFVMVRRP